MKLITTTLLLLSLFSCTNQEVEEVINISLNDQCNEDAFILKEKFIQCGWHLNEANEDLCADEATLYNDYKDRLGTDILCR